jgi:F0F1-type ATP synthase membrane subunit b/b'
MSRLLDAFRAMIAEAETEVSHAIHTEEKKVEAMITDALNALSAAKDAVLAKIANDAAELSQTATDRDAAQAALATAQQQLADAETQINAITAQLNP